LSEASASTVRGILLLRGRDGLRQERPDIDLNREGHHTHIKAVHAAFEYEERLLYIILHMTTHENKMNSAMGCELQRRLRTDRGRMLRARLEANLGLHLCRDIQITIN